MMFLLLNMLSMLDIAFLARSKQAYFIFMAAFIVHNDFGAQDKGFSMEFQIKLFPFIGTDTKNS